MATKKQKHAAAMARREQFLAEVKATGLQAQRTDQEFRKRKEEQALAAADMANFRLLAATHVNGKSRGKKLSDMSIAELEEAVKVSRSALAISH